MTILQAIVLAIVEGVTEFLPISSTGHIILTARLMGILQTEFVKSFEIIIQLGAICAIFVLYGKRLLINRKVFIRTAFAFLPTAIAGFLLYPFIKHTLLDNPYIVVSALFLGGIALIVLERISHNNTHEGTIETLGLRQSFFIGMIQSISFIPGVSRAAATIFGGLFAGLKRSEAVEFSFLLAVPTMAAATGLDIVKTNMRFTSGEYLLLGTGCIVSFGVALAVAAWFLRYIKTNTFTLFGVYRIILAILYTLFVLK